MFLHLFRLYKNDFLKSVLVKVEFDLFITEKYWL